MTDSAASGVLVRLAIQADAETMVDVHIHSWQWAYKGIVADAYLSAFGLPNVRQRRLERRRQELATPPPGRREWVAEWNGRVVGIAITGPSRDTDTRTAIGEVQAIYLEHDAAGHGIGRALFACVVEDMRQQGYAEATLWVLADNARAQHFYEAAGWHTDGETKVEERPGAMLHEVRYRVHLA